eukprot:3512839-Pyramimonas_sp.AAC.1
MIFPPPPPSPLRHVVVVHRQMSVNLRLGLHSKTLRTCALTYAGRLSQVSVVCAPNAGSFHVGPSWVPSGGVAAGRHDANLSYAAHHVENEARATFKLVCNSLHPRNLRLPSTRSHLTLNGRTNTRGSRTRMRRGGKRRKMGEGGRGEQGGDGAGRGCGWIQGMRLAALGKVTSVNKLPQVLECE